MKRPDKNKVVFTGGVPLVAQQFDKLYAHIESPSQWQELYAVTIVSDDGKTAIFKLVPRKRGNVDAHRRNRRRQERDGNLDAVELQQRRLCRDGESIWPRRGEPASWNLRPGTSRSPGTWPTSRRRSAITRSTRRFPIASSRASDPFRSSTASAGRSRTCAFRSPQVQSSMHYCMPKPAY